MSAPARPVAPSPALVASCAAEVLRDGTGVDPHTPLLDLPGFSSLVLAELVERIEQALGAEFPPELILPATFETPATIAGALGWTGAGGERTGGQGSDEGSDDLGRDADLVRPRQDAAFLHQLLDAAARDSGEQVAVRHGDRALPYGELRAEALDLAGWLRTLGVRRGDRVVVGLGNVPGTLVALHALSRLGAIFVPVDPATPAWSLGHVLADARPVLALGPLGEAVAAAGGGVAVEQLPAALPRAAEPARWEPDATSDPACILYTSGSTGLPRGVVCPHGAMLFALGAIGDRVRIAPGDVIGNVLPLTFDYGLYQSLLATQARATLALGGPAEAGPGLARFLARHRVTGLPVVPSLAATLIQLAERQPAAERSPLRWVTNTGAALPPAVAARLAELFPGVDLYPMYGLTECKRVSVLLPEERGQRPASVGRPLDGTEVAIVDPATGADLPAGEVGEIVVRGPHVMAGYWGIPPGEDLRFRPCGPGGELALHTGDRGHLDAEGYLYFDGRDDDVYKSSGFRVSATEVELAAAEVAGVRECAVLVPTPERPATLVVAGEASAHDVRTGLLARLDRHKVPERVVVLARLPHTGNGKVDRAALAAAMEEAT